MMSSHGVQDIVPGQENAPMPPSSDRNPKEAGSVTESKQVAGKKAWGTYHYLNRGANGEMVTCNL